MGKAPMQQSLQRSALTHQFKNLRFESFRLSKVSRPAPGVYVIVGGYATQIERLAIDARMLSLIRRARATGRHKIAISVLIAPAVPRYIIDYNQFRCRLLLLRRLLAGGYCAAKSMNPRAGSVDISFTVSLSPTSRSLPPWTSMPSTWGLRVRTKVPYWFTPVTMAG